MNKQTFEHVKKILTTHRVYANGINYSLSIHALCGRHISYYRIEVYSNYAHGSFHNGYASFFCHVAEICGCSCSFASVNNVCVCEFY